MSTDVPATEFFHELYGFTLRVNRRLPGLASCGPSSHKIASLRDNPLNPPIGSLSTIGVRLDESPAGVATARVPETPLYVSEYLGDFGAPILKIYDVDSRRFLLCYDDGTEFAVSRDGGEIRATWPSSMTFEDTVTYLVGPVMGFVMHLRGRLCLHASVVAISDHAVVLLGAAGAGKSTTAAAFSRLGFPVLSDDVAALEVHDSEKDSQREGEYIVHPGYRRICLTPEATQLLYGAPGMLPAITPNWEKRGLDLGHPHARFESRALPLGAIYLLGERNASRSAIQIELLSPRESLLELLAHTYVQYFLTPRQRAAEFPSTARLAAQMPLRRVLRPEGAGHMAEDCARLAEDFAEVLGGRIISS
jgi:hypothetical protein